MNKIPNRFNFLYFALDLKWYSSIAITIIWKYSKYITGRIRLIPKFCVKNTKHTYKYDKNNHNPRFWILFLYLLYRAGA